MANKVAAMLVICLVLVAAVHQPTAVAAKSEYARCFEDCEKRCMDKRNGYSICEMQCDADCFNKDVASKLKIDLN